MKNSIRILIVLLLYLPTGCVTVTLGTDKVTKAEGIIFKKPSDPFQSIKNDHTDYSWQSKKTGNLIAFQSECSKTEDPKFETLENESLLALDTTDQHEIKEITFKNREAHLLFAKGKIDGVSVTLNNLIFKRNGCVYILSYTGLSSKIAVEQNIFEQFKMDFEAP